MPGLQIGAEFAGNGDLRAFLDGPNLRKLPLVATMVHRMFDGGLTVALWQGLKTTLGKKV